MSSSSPAARVVASAMVAGPINRWEDLRDRVKPVLGDLRRARWLTPLAKATVETFGLRTRPTAAQMAKFISSHSSFAKAFRSGRVTVFPEKLAQIAPEMVPATGAPTQWETPCIANVPELCALLALHPDDLGWAVFAVGLV